MKSKSLIIIGTSVFALALMFALPAKVSYTITTRGKILCNREWIVALNANAGLITTLVERGSGVTKRYFVAPFDRGDAIQFSLDPHIASGTRVSAGDTIGVVQSSEIERELERLKGELGSARASLALTVTGEKQSIVEAARQEVEHARRESDNLNAVLARQKLLFERGLVAKQEYELAERRASVSAIDVSIAEARLQSVITGAKREQADFVRAQISSLEREIEVLERRQQGYRLVSPLSGMVMQVAASDTLLIVSDTTAYVVVMPVPLRERSLLAPQQQVKIFAREVEHIPRAVVLAVDKSIYSLNGEQVVFATAVLENGTDELLHGLLARCSIECASLSPFDYLRRKFYTLVR